MQLGMVGLGRMGANMVRRLMKAGHRCVATTVTPHGHKSWPEKAPRQQRRSMSSSPRSNPACSVGHGARWTTDGRSSGSARRADGVLRHPDRRREPYYKDDVRRARQMKAKVSSTWMWDKRGV